jgi:signal transduction histidine kinase
VAKSASTTSESGRWSALIESERVFSGGVRQAIHRKGNFSDTATLRNLFEQHETVVRLEQDLLEVSEQRVAKAEEQLEAESRQLASRAILLLGACFALAFLCAALTIIFARKSIRSLEWHANELGRVSWHMLQSQEEAARRFSHELHDELGQSLAAVRANLTSTDARDWSSRREDCMSLVDGAIANVRELSQLLRPVILDDFGLDAGLRWLSERFSERTGVRVHYISTFKGRLPDITETHLFRIAQEAFTNIARHSGASEVRVALSSDNDDVSLTVEDNGRGIVIGDTLHSPSLGMTGMRARARQAGGQFRTAKPAGGGLRIEIQVPKVMPRETHAV